MKHSINLSQDKVGHEYMEVYMNIIPMEFQ